MTAERLGRPMRRFRRSDRGLSEIVGTLMLVVIVVGAATILAAFVASYQKQLQTEVAFSHDQNLESIKILGLTTAVNNGVFTGFNFTLASEYVNPSGIFDVYINGDPLLDFAWTNVSTGLNGTYDPEAGQTDMVILPFQQVTIETCLVKSCVLNGATVNNSFIPGDEPVPNHYIKFDVITHLDNDFSRSYLPPTPLPIVSELNPSGNNPITLLDGSTSFQPGTNESIVNWAWGVSGIGLESTSTDLLGSNLYVNDTPAANGDLMGGLVNGTGETANFSIPMGFSFGLANFTIGGNLHAGGGGCMPLTDTWILGQHESISGSTLTVTFNFSAMIPLGCKGATLSLAPTGVALNITGSAVGEEYEVSPALGPLEVDNSYSVSLTVTNSDGLEGTSSVAYSPPA